ncbi:MAG TPA: UDP-N-acetylglucosamine 2-epimerase (non-hydrolyzing) [Syntrophorhabdaceae bacterium]|nr:UDP-N-acetylglucosamine 2-epimerase (non-hydrolyzing) [Syntrophorhabdaceae bacterium]
MKVLFVFGTRPEAIKMAPIIHEMRRDTFFRVKVCITAQHRQMLDQVLRLFNISPDIDLDIMKPNQSLAELTSSVVKKIDEVLLQEKPDLVVIQGDTTTVMAAGLAAFYQRIPVGHVEAGLRSHNIYSPFPEELNRRVVSLFAKYHFAPTENAKRSLMSEGIRKDDIFVVGNTVIDALFHILRTDEPEFVREIRRSLHGRRLILVTAHRRENFGKRIKSICNGIKRVVERNPNVVVVYPVHLNPNVKEPVYRILGNTDRVILTDPVDYNVLVHLMNISYLILTDSGGIQEEAPSLGKPVLVMRTETERPEGIEAGTAKLIGSFEENILKHVESLLHDQGEYERMAKAVNPYGDGTSSKRIVDILKKQASNNRGEV